MSEHPPSPPLAHRTEEEWRGIAKGMIKGELKRQNLTYEDLASKLAAIGVEENESSIRNKISRGTFSATFLLQALNALGAELIPYRPTILFESRIPSQRLNDS